MYKTNFPPEGERLRDKAPNKPFVVGRDVRIIHKLEPYLAVTVSPYHPDFQTQIEPGIWSLVKALNEKGYHTTSSCEGHYNDDTHKSSPMVIVTFTSDWSKEVFVERMMKIPGTLIEDNIDEELFNTEYDTMSETFHRATSKSDSEHRVQYLNDMFMKKSDYYTFVRVYLNKFTGYDPIRWADRYLFKNKFCTWRMIQAVKGLPQL
jgi:hypothetical protein